MERIPIYCKNCGSKLKQKSFIESYDERTGEPIMKIRVVCKRCQKNGIVVYLADFWNPTTAKGEVGPT